MPLLKRTSEDHHYSRETDSVSQDNRPQKRSKKVPQRVRQSASKDKKTLARMRSFRVPAHLLVEETSVAHPTSFIPTSLNTPTPFNDNIPVWALTGDVVKAVAATAALQIAEKPAYAFTFNLTPEAEAKALTQSKRFVDSLKRSFDKQLDRAGVRLPYWFAIDITRKGRLHIHGAFGAATENENLKAIMWKAWGKQKLYPQFQIDIRPLRDDGWATYVFRMPNHRRVAKRIGQTLTMTRPLQQDAKWTYAEVRRIMRGEVGLLPPSRPASYEPPRAAIQAAQSSA